MKKNNVNNLNLKIIDLNSLLEGMDLSIFFSIINFLAIYYLKEISYNLSLIFIICIILISFIIRIFIPPLIKKIIYKIDFFLLQFVLLTFGYGLLLITQNNFFGIFSILFLFISRISIGIYFALFNSQIFGYFDEKVSIHSNLKHWFLIIMGILFGFVLVQILNDIYSNSALSSGSWKWVIVILFTLGLIKLFLEKKKKIDFEPFKSFIINFQYAFDKKFFKIFFQNIILLVPITFLIFYSCSFWLPSSVLPENKQFSEILIINIVLVIISMFSSHFIFELISKSKCFLLVLYSGIFLFMFMSFTSDNFSSYKISLMHFVLSIYSGMSLSLYNFGLFGVKIESNKYAYTLYSALLLLTAVFVPIFIYQLIFNSVEYKYIYLFLFFLYSLGLFSYYLFKKEFRS